MDLDYSKLTTRELEAIANNDYSKLSTKTLEALANPPKAPEKTAKDYVKEFGQSTASLADTILGAPAAIGQQIGYATGRAFGLSPEEATRSSLKVTEPFMNPVGNAFGVTETPAYQNEASRRLMQGVQENVVQPIATATGLPEQDVGSMVGTATMAAGPLMGRAGQAASRAAFAAEPYVAGAAKNIAYAPKGLFYDAPKGAIRGFVEPYNEATSAMIPLREQYTPIPAAQRFMGEMPNVPPQSLEQLQSQARPTSELINTPVDRIASAIAPTNAAGETLVPLQGKGWEAWGERVGRGVKEKPGQALLEAGITAVTGIPFKTVGQGVQELAARYLGNKTGFSPKLPEAVRVAKTKEAFMPEQQPQLPYDSSVAPTPLQVEQSRAGLQANMPPPMLENNPTVAPVNPNTMFVGEQGIAGTSLPKVTQAELAKKYAPQPSQTPKEFSQDLAQQKLEQGFGQQPTPAPAPVEAPVAPVAPEGIQTPAKEPTMLERLAALRKAENEGTPKQQTPAQIEREQNKMAKESQIEQGREIIGRLINGEKPGEGMTSSMGQQGKLWGLDDADVSNNVKGKIRILQKAGVYELPFIPGMSEGQIIDLAYKELTGKGLKNVQAPTKTTPATTPKTRTVEDIRKELNDVSSQAEDLQSSGLEQKIQHDTPVGDAYQAKLGELAQKAKELEKELETAKKAEKKSGKKDLGTEIKLPKEEKFDPNNAQQSYDLLAETSPMEKRYRDYSQEQLAKAEKDLSKVLDNPNSYKSDVDLAKEALKVIRKYKK